MLFWWSFVGHSLLLSLLTSILVDKVRRGGHFVKGNGIKEKGRKYRLWM